jgi:hypothetical protein
LLEGERAEEILAEVQVPDENGSDENAPRTALQHRRPETRALQL